MSDEKPIVVKVGDFPVGHITEFRPGTTATSPIYTLPFDPDTYHVSGPTTITVEATQVAVFDPFDPAGNVSLRQPRNRAERRRRRKG